MTSLKSLKEKALAATQGNWEVERFDSYDGYIHFSVNDPKMQQVAFCHEDIHPKTYRADANFIAASNPQTVLALIADLELAREALEKCQKSIEYIHNEYPDVRVLMNKILDRIQEALEQMNVK